MRSALPELKLNIFTNTLLTDIQNPFVIEYTRVFIAFSAHNHKLCIVEIFLDIDAFKKRLSRYAAVFYRQLMKN